MSGLDDNMYVLCLHQQPVLSYQFVSSVFNCLQNLIGTSRQFAAGVISVSFTREGHSRQNLVNMRIV